MATLDTLRNLIVVRIVYDGPPMSGKTTSVRMLADGLERKTVTPSEARGRTLFFDWMDYVGGLFEGHRIRCQIVSVPGQAALARRRRFLLSTADSVVFVADTSKTEWERSRAALEETYDHLQSPGRLPVGVVLQANKRDRPDAVPSPRLREELADRPSLGIIETVASEGRGIREAFVFGVRLALDRVRELIRHGKLEQGTPTVDNPEALLAALTAAEADQEVRYAPDEEDTAKLPRKSLDARIAPPASHPTPAMDIGLALRYPETASTLANLARHAESRSDGRSLDTPELPNSGVPSGRIWPPVEGRVLLNEIEGRTARELAVRTTEGHWQVARTDLDWILHSHAESEFGDARDGEAELLMWARMHAGGRHRLSEGRCIVLAQAGADRWRLWQIVRKRPSIEALVRASLDTGNAALITKTLFDAARLLATAYTSFDEPPCRLPCTIATVGNADWRAVFLGLFPAPGQGERPVERPMETDFAWKQLSPIVRSHEAMGRVNLDEAQATLHRLSSSQPDQRSAAEAVRILLVS
ncbi:MAG TPA: hypothetical protein VJT73_11170 [Polyangiaceae bacterium]|nr:hypothetical protein [Polyangiaceae bacterium]